MITELIPNKIYYAGHAHPPFYEEASCTNVNVDGTYDTEKHKRYATISIAKDKWHMTKEEAIEEMVQYYADHFHQEDMSLKANIYQRFQNDMAKYTKEHRPEYWL